MSGVFLNENVAEEGAVGYLAGTSVTLSGGQVGLNVATAGGGFYVDSLVALEIEASDFTSNTPDDLQYADGSTYSFGVAATVSCDASGCE